jgi:hypothetical protein
MARRGTWGVAASALGALLLCGCGSHLTGPDKAPPGSLPAQFQTQLDKELKALGKDPSQTTTEAPTKDDDVVFDLAAVLLDGNGQPLPPGSPSVSGVRLAWTERLTGDYDQNGEVNTGDLAPLAQHLQAAVQYDTASQHGGFAAWPSGDPDTAGAANWRLARINGDNNGLITSADITPIAKHWKEALQGYRVYRKGPSDTSFKLLPNPDDAGSSVTVTKPTPPQPGQLVPVRYSFTDSQATAGSLGAGVYEFYVAPYDSGSKQEGVSSFAVSVDITTGTVNHAPVAQLTATPGFAGAPAPITLDATGSYDTDGTVTEYDWDVDGDGTVDYKSTDPAPPAQSSSGAAVGLTVLGTGKLQVTFPNGSDQWINPTVTVLDNQGLYSPPATHPLAVTGWQNTVITGGQQISHDVDFQVLDMQPDPTSVRVLAAGVGTLGTETAEGLCLAWIDGDSITEQAEAMPFSDPQIAQIYGFVPYTTNVTHFVLGFTSDLHPMAVLSTMTPLGIAKYQYNVISMEQLSTGQWEAKRIEADYSGEHTVADYLYSGNYMAPGQFTINCTGGDGETVGSHEPIFYVYSSDASWRFELASDDNSAGTNASHFALDSKDILHCLPGGAYWNQSGIFLATYQAPETWKVDTLAPGEFDLSGRKTVVTNYRYSTEGQLYLAVSRFLTESAPYYDNSDIVVLKQAGSGFEATALGALDGDESGFWLQGESAYVFSYGERNASGNEGIYLQEVTPSAPVVDDTICSIAMGAGSPPVQSVHSCINADGAAYAVYSVDYGPDGNAQYFARRLDPRISHP